MSAAPATLAFLLAASVGATAAPGGPSGDGSPVPAETRQMLLATSTSWDATRALVQAYERRAAGGPWAPVGPAVEAALGRSGLAWGRGRNAAVADGPQKREGDGRSPAGVFDLRLATGYAKAPPAGTRLAYRPASETLRCVDDPRSRSYNRLVDEAAVAKDWSSAEDMRRPDELYRLVVWVGHNDSPVVPGGGSCIFLHQRSGPESVTAGCTAFDADPLERLFAWLDPAARPVLVQLPEGEYRARAAAWDLPEPRPRALGRPAGRLRSGPAGKGQGSAAER